MKKPLKLISTLYGERHKCKESEGKIPVIRVESNGNYCFDCGKKLNLKEVFNLEILE